MITVLHLAQKNEQKLETIRLYNFNVKTDLLTQFLFITAR